MMPNCAKASKRQRALAFVSEFPHYVSQTLIFGVHPFDSKTNLFNMFLNSANVMLGGA